jgi:hypothetical protein
MRFLPAHMIAFLLVTFAANATAAEISPETVILAVGVDRYQDKFWPALKFATTDAKTFASELASASINPARTIVLENNAATAPAVRSTLQALRQSMNPRDRLIVYFSGHGTLAQVSNTGGDLSQVIVLNDTSGEKPFATGIGHAELRRLIDRIPATRKMMILATCHSGIGKSRLSPLVQELIAGNKGRVATEPSDGDDDGSEGFLLFAAAARGETAREDARLKGDIYTHFFLEALRAGDRDGDGVVTALEAHDYARQKTSTMSGGSQRPTFEGQAIGRFDFALAGRKRPGGRPVLTAYENNLQGYSLQVRGGEKGTLPSGFVLQPGMNVIEVYPPEGDRPAAVFQLRAQEDEQVTIDEILRPAPWTVGLDLGKSYFSDGNAKKIAASGQAYALRVHAAWIPGRWHLPWSFGLSWWESSMKNEGVATGIKNESYYYGVNLEAGLRWQDLQGRFLKVRTMMGPGHLDLRFKDDRSGATSKFSQAANQFGLDAAIGQFLTQSRLADLQWDLGLRYESGRFAFKDLGTVSMDHTTIYVGMEAAVGAKARRVR